jgi:hypothetical protein
MSVEHGMFTKTPAKTSVATDKGNPSALGGIGLIAFSPSSKYFCCRNGNKILK